MTHTSLRIDTRSHLIPKMARNTLIIALEEFCGTFMFLFKAFVSVYGAVYNYESSTGRLAPASLLYIATAFGTSLAINA